jgi:hypothetical protein
MVGIGLPIYDPPPSGADAMDWAKWRTRRGFPTVDDTWMLRDVEQDKRNKQRFDDWATRFKVLGPREQDTPLTFTDGGE